MRTRLCGWENTHVGTLWCGARNTLTMREITMPTQIGFHDIGPYIAYCFGTFVLRRASVWGAERCVVSTSHHMISMQAPAQHTTQ